MNLRLTVARIYLPGFIRKKQLQALFKLTADAFEREMPAIQGLCYRDCLDAYARFSKAQAERVIISPQEAERARERLYRAAYGLGEKLRYDFRLTKQTDVLRFSEILYRILGIDFRGDQNGAVIISRCFFSQYYTAPVCRLISALDEGVAAGLSKGGDLTFTARISEGEDCCLARFSMKDP